MTEVASVLTQRARHARGLIQRDYERLNLADRYLRGFHRAPFIPKKANPEFRALVKRSFDNIVPLIVDAPTNAMGVDGYRRSGSDTNAPEWKWWQANRLDQRQHQVHRGALAAGHSYVTVLPGMRPGEKRDRPQVRAYDAVKTVAVYEDPTFDPFPLYALHLDRTPGDGGQEPHTGRLIDDQAVYHLDFESGDPKVTKVEQHGMGVCPVVRFAPAVDLQGRTQGLVERVMTTQDRINQMTLNMLIAQHYGAFAIRFATGLAPVEVLDEYGDPVRDENGQPTFLPPVLDPSTLLVSPNAETEFGQLPAQSTKDLQDSIAMAVKHACMVTETPPHYVMSDMVNMAADALAAAESAFMRKVAEVQAAFGESWESVMRLCALVAGDRAGFEDEESEVVWADRGNRSFAQAADAGLKLSQIGVPLGIVLRKVPGFTQSDIDEAVKEWKAAQEQRLREIAASQQAKAPDEGVNDGDERGRAAGDSRVPAGAGAHSR
ncbi:phage portal protein [Streptomyces luteoverticillatus]|uniref:phage portal protein n=1 Tax=Streptomyces luteoverticillatus TaxID=66425 RepID=UPI0013DEBAFC|nr:phage portal protein [Streptomyces luteoverticillatus]